jgi:hypothetical protein
MGMHVDAHSGSVSDFDRGNVRGEIIDNESDQVPKGRSVDALAVRGDEGRGTLR